MEQPTDDELFEWAHVLVEELSEANWLDDISIARRHVLRAYRRGWLNGFATKLEVKEKS